MVTKPWDRQTDEPASWYARFDAFRLLGPLRTLESAWRSEQGQQGSAQVGKNKRPSPSWYEQSARWRWRERAEAWDESERQRLLRQRGRELEEAQKRHGAVAQLMLAKGIEALEGLDALSLPPNELRLYLATGIELELKSLVEPLVLELLRRVEKTERQLSGDSDRPSDQGPVPSHQPSGSAGAVDTTAPPSHDALPD